MPECGAYDQTGSSNTQLRWRKQEMGTLLWLTAAILDIFAVSDVMRSKRDWATKVVLLAIILLIPFIGAGLYLFAFRDKGYS
jgi:Phospholipase_D-nuclease N-terminal